MQRNLIGFAVDRIFLSFRDFSSKQNSIIVYFHSVNSGKFLGFDGFPVLTMEPNLFEACLCYLKKNYNIISLTELYQFIQRKQVPKGFAVVTFDDGYKDNYKIAFPILKSLNIPATIFLTVNYLRNQDRGIGLSWEEIQEMLTAGITFGSHSMTHSRLAHLSPRQAQKEIKQSKQIIEDKLGISCEFFSYPHGNFNDKIIDLVQQSDYKGAVSTLEGSVTSSTSLYAIPRITTSHVQSITDFAVVATCSHLWRRSLKHYWNQDPSTF